MNGEIIDGRSEPRSGPVTHQVRFYVECAPCGWRSELEPVHTDAELARLVRMHTGDEAS